MTVVQEPRTHEDVQPPADAVPSGQPGGQPGSNGRRRAVRGPGHWLALTWRIVVTLVLVALVAALAVSVLIPRLGGATPYTVLTGSMKPDLPPGTLVVVKPIDGPDDLAVGDVVTYQINSGRPEFATHRVVAVHTTMTGETRWETKGDANEESDAELVREKQIRGELWYSAPYLGRGSALFEANQRQLAVYVVAGGLGLYALSMFIGALRHRSRRRATA